MPPKTRVSKMNSLRRIAQPEELKTVGNPSLRLVAELNYYIWPTMGQTDNAYGPVPVTRSNKPGPSFSSKKNSADC